MQHRMRAALVAAILAVGSAGAVGATDGPQLSASDGDPSEVIPTLCGQGMLTECGSRTTKKCLEWKYMPTVGGSLSPGGGGGTLGYTATCALWEEVTMKLYKDRPA